MHGIITVWGAMLALSLCACAQGGNHSERLKTETHRNGLVINIADTLKVEQTEGGFHIYPPNGLDRRSPVEATAELHAGEPAPPGEWPEEKRVGERTVHYRIDESDGGSGGREYDMQAWEPYPGGYILYRERIQSEGKPDFELLWGLVEGTRAPGTK